MTVETTVEDTDDDDEGFHFHKESESYNENMQFKTSNESKTSYSDFAPPKTSISTQLSGNIVESHDAVVHKQWTVQPPIVESRGAIHEQFVSYRYEKENEAPDATSQNFQILQNRYTALKRQRDNVDEKEKAKRRKEQEESAQLREKLEATERENAQLKRNLAAYQQEILKCQEESATSKQISRELTTMKEKMALLEQPSRKIKDPDMKMIHILKAVPTNSIMSQIGSHPIRFEAQTPSIDYPLADEVVKTQLMFNKFLLLAETDKETFEGCLPYFGELIPIISQLCKVIIAGKMSKSKGYIDRKSFVNHQAQLLSAEFNINDRQLPANYHWNKLVNESKYLDEVRSSMTCALSYPNEKNKNVRILIEILSQFAENSFIMSYFIAIGDTAQGKHSKGNSKKVKQPETILGMLANTVKKYIPQTQGLESYLGLTDAMAALALAISKHYKKFDNHAVIDSILTKYFNALIMISLNNTGVLVKLTQFMVNVSSVPDYNRLLPKLCRNKPNISQLNQMIFIPLCGCELQVLFLLLVNAFPYNEDVPQYQLDDLFTLTRNLNVIAFQFFTHGNAMKCVEDVQNFEAGSCKCLYGLINAITSLHKKVLEQRQIRKYSLEIKGAIKSYINSAVTFLRYTRDLKHFLDMKRIHLELNNLYMIVKEGLMENSRPPYIPEVLEQSQLELVNFDPEILSYNEDTSVKEYSEEDNKNILREIEEESQRLLENYCDM